MKILFIEDEVGKQKQVLKFVKEEIESCDIEIAQSLMAGMRLIRGSVYDIVLLDMSLPLYDLNGENEEMNEFESFGGMEILDELIRKNVKAKAIVITAFDVIEDDTRKLNLMQLDLQMRENYSECYLGSIHFDPSSLEWKNELKGYLEEL